MHKTSLFRLQVQSLVTAKCDQKNNMPNNAEALIRSYGARTSGLKLGRLAAAADEH